MEELDAAPLLRCAGWGRGMMSNAAFSSDISSFMSISPFRKINLCYLILLTQQLGFSIYTFKLCPLKARQCFQCFSYFVNFLLIKFLLSFLLNFADFAYLLSLAQNFSFTLLSSFHIKNFLKFQIRIFLFIKTTKIHYTINLIIMR